MAAQADRRGARGAKRLSAKESEDEEAADEQDQDARQGAPREADVEIDEDAANAPAPAALPAPRPADVIPFRRPETEVDKPTARREQQAPTPARRKDGAALAPGLARTRSGWVSRLGELFTGKHEIDPALLDEVEKVLLTADIGVRTSQKLLEEMRSSLSRKELNDPRCGVGLSETANRRGPDPGRGAACAGAPPNRLCCWSSG